MCLFEMFYMQFLLPLLELNTFSIYTKFLNCSLCLINDLLLCVLVMSVTVPMSPFI